MENERMNSIEDGLLSEEDYQRIDVFVQKIDITDTKLANSFGRSAQKQIAACSASILESAKNKDMSLVKESLRKLRTIIDQAAILELEKELQKHLQELTKDQFVYEQMYDISLEHHKELLKYLMAGQKLLEQVRNSSIRQMYPEACQRFENRIANLETTRQVSLQLLTQIRIFMEADKEIIEKLRDNLNHTIPLWRNQQALTVTVKR